MAIGAVRSPSSASIIGEPETLIKKKPSSTSSQIRVLVLTSNPLKQAEFKKFLGETYGVALSFRPPPEELTQALAKKIFTGEDPSLPCIRKILAEESVSPHYILREETRLIDALSKKVLSGLDVVESPINVPSFLYNVADLYVWIPKWGEDATLRKIEHLKYSHSVRGFINPSLSHLKDPHILGWDHLFVNPSTGKTNFDNADTPWGKNSARQIVLGDFVTEYLFYQNPKSLQHHRDLKPHQAIEFTKEMSVSRFMQENKYISNPNLNRWGLKKMMEGIFDEGVFFKAGTSRPVKNFFSPPFGGIPITSKKSDVEETIFMFHDLGHHLIPDLLFDGDDSIEMRNVYIAWRMMSEAMTLVLADMLYANTLVTSYPECEKHVDSRIYGLFKALNIEDVNDDNRQRLMTSLLWANTQYAVLGDDSEWRKLLKEGESSKLESYERHFEKFFVGDHVWSDANYRNMAALKDTYKTWTALIGQDLLEKANLLLLSDVTKKLKEKGADLSSFEETVSYVFQEIISQRIFRKVAQISDSERGVSEEERLSRAFRRYMIGQLSFYSRYQGLDGVFVRGQKLRQEIAQHEFFSAEIRESLYRQYVNDVRYVWGTGCITTSTAANLSQIHPIFPPVYINYSKQEYKTVKEAVLTLSEEKKQPKLGDKNQ